MFEIIDIIRGMLAIAGYLTDGPSLKKPLTAAEEAELIARMKRGDEAARCDLIEHNMRLVVHITKKYVNTRIENDDLISIGTIGLIKAVNTYEPERGTSLATYSARCIENEILMAMRAGKKRSGEVSLEEPIGTDREGNEISLIDILDDESPAVPDVVDTVIRSEKLMRLVDTVLTPRERMVICMRYGLAGLMPRTQREIAGRLGISRSYVSRIEKRACERLASHFTV